MSDVEYSAWQAAVDKRGVELRPSKRLDRCDEPRVDDQSELRARGADGNDRVDSHLRVVLDLSVRAPGR